MSTLHKSIGQFSRFGSGSYPVAWCNTCSLAYFVATEISHKDHDVTVVKIAGKLLNYLDDWQVVLLSKFIARMVKHPGEQSVTHPDYDWSSPSELIRIEQHLLSEFFERFPQVARDLNLDVSKLTLDSPEKEDVDIGNLSFLDWKFRTLNRDVDIGNLSFLDWKFRTLNRDTCSNCLDKKHEQCDKLDQHTNSCCCGVLVLGERV